MKAFSALLLAMFVLAGCGGGLEKKVVGSWKPDMSKSDLGPSGDKGKEAEAMKKAIVENIKLDLKEDHTFNLVILFPLEGKWKLEGSKLILDFSKQAGTTMKFGGKETLDFDVDGSGTSMTFTSIDPKEPGKLVLVKN